MDKETKKIRAKLRKNFKIIKDDMIALGTYRPEFDEIIRQYAQLTVQYDTVFNRWIEQGMPSEAPSSGGVKKNPTVAILEDLRRQIVTYSDRLGLSPKALDGIKGSKKSGDSESFLGGVLSSINDEIKND